MPAPWWDLSGWGLSVVVSVSDHLPPQAASRFEWGTRGGAAGEGGVLFAHWPFEDGALPDLGLLDLVAGVVAAAVLGRRRVLVHCQEGRNRSGVVAALAVRQLSGCTGSEAVARVRRARPGMVSNREFSSYLEGLPAPAGAGTTTATPDPEG